MHTFEEIELLNAHKNIIIIIIEIVNNQFETDYDSKLIDKKWSKYYLIDKLIITVTNN